MPIGATITGVFTLGLIIGALAAPWLPRTESDQMDDHMTTLIEELEADFGPERVRAAVLRARMRQSEAGLY
jgi:hypothetical protein